jgi:hypothetical protein
MQLIKLIIPMCSTTPQKLQRERQEACPLALDNKSTYLMTDVNTPDSFRRVGIFSFPSKVKCCKATNRQKYSYALSKGKGGHLRR